MGFIVILIGIIFWVYFYNRKKYHNLKHQIPASVVKNYLDSIIQNSHALKSSLFRGGGIDVDAAGVPSVLPIDQSIIDGGQVGVSLDAPGSGAVSSAEILKLKTQIADKQSVLEQLETENANLSGVNSKKQERIEDLEKRMNSGDVAHSENSSGDLDAVTAERDELKEELEQYAVISDDLADLKRLKQENAQLKEALGVDDADQVSPEELAKVETQIDAELDDIAGELEEEPTEAVAETSEEVPTEEVVAETSEEIAEPTAEAEEVAQDDNPKAEEVKEEVSAASEDGTEKGSGYEKSPEDLLSEFEKMLG